MAVDLHLSQNPDADKVISANHYALLMGMLLDQQVLIEVAFAAPATLERRLGKKLSPATIAKMDPDELAAVFAERPALHRYPGSMARRVHDLSRVLVEEYGGKADRVWAGVGSGTELVARLKALPGFGEQKAKIFAALLGKQLGVRPEGWREATSPYGDEGSFRSVADILDPETLNRVRSSKADMKAKAKAKAGAK
ncbi:MAG TPA: HhH-GPD-type base excision DNA repair protein [Acidimicrobiales bacterium]|nr:HhH-GPD-type base excision DNA repair protein [Acidimicrobiales bacterium]